MKIRFPDFNLLIFKDSKSNFYLFWTIVIFCIKNEARSSSQYKVRRGYEIESILDETACTDILFIVRKPFSKGSINILDSLGKAEMNVGECVVIINCFLSLHETYCIISATRR